jgi:hypothetical protein
MGGDGAMDAWEYTAGKGRVAELVCHLSFRMRALEPRP